MNSISMHDRTFAFSSLCLRTLFAMLFAVLFAAMLLALPSPAAAQKREGVQNDYQEYQRLFLTGREPDLSTDTSWRKKYERHEWADEAKRGNTDAKILTALYLLSSVDQQLEVEIERIVLTNPMMSNALASGHFLDKIDGFFRKFPDAADTLQGTGNAYGIYRVGLPSEAEEYIGTICKHLRASVTSPVPGKVRMDNRRILQMFQTKDPDETPAEQWADVYYYMRERVDLLQELRHSFYHNLNAEERKEKHKALLNDKDFVTAIKKSLTVKLARALMSASRVQVVRVGDTDYATIEIDVVHQVRSRWTGILYAEWETTERGLSFMGKNLADMPDGKKIVYVSSDELISNLDFDAIVENRTIQVITDLIEYRAKRHEVHRYLTDVYSDFDYHMDTMKRIEKYLRDGTKIGDILAMYHYGLFMKNFGDLLDDEHPQQTALKWFDKAVKEAAALPDPNLKMKKRIEDLTKQIAAQNAEKPKREKKKKERITKLITLEEEKIDAVDSALLTAANRLSNDVSSSTTSSTVDATNNNNGNKGANQPANNNRPSDGNQPAPGN